MWEEWKDVQAMYIWGKKIVLFVNTTITLLLVREKLSETQYFTWHADDLACGMAYLETLHW